MFTVNLDENKKVASDFAVEGIPTVIYLANGKEVHRTEGAMEENDFLQEILAAYSGAGTPLQAAAAPAQSTVPAAAPAAAPTPEGVLPAFEIVAGVAAVGLLGWLIFG